MSILSISFPQLLESDAPSDVRPSLAMSEQEFLAWVDEDTHAEWADGKVIFMAAENIIHIELKYWLVWLLKTFISRKQMGGRVIGSEFLIRLSAQGRLRTPDIFYVASARESLIQRTYLDGAPDLAVEIVSPESQSRDRRDKYNDYEKAGVREYWIVDPLSQTVEAYTLGQSSTYEPIAAVDGHVASVLLPGFYLKAQWLWREPLPDVIETLGEMGV